MKKMFNLWIIITLISVAGTAIAVDKKKAGKEFSPGNTVKILY
jgi:hypothetical protein